MFTDESTFSYCHVECTLNKLIHSRRNYVMGVERQERMGYFTPSRHHTPQKPLNLDFYLPLIISYRSLLTRCISKLNISMSVST